MAINYPTSLDGTTQFGQPSGTSLLTSPDHAAQHDNLSSLGTTLENVLGTTAGTSVLKNFAVGDFAARINSGGTLQQVLTGTLNNGVLGTPTITGGSYNSGIIGTPSIQQGTLLEPFIDTHSIGSAAWTGTAAGTTNLNLGTAQRLLVTMPNSAGSVLLTVSNVVVNRPFMVEVLQGTAGLGTIGWFGTINRWASSNGSALILGTTPSKKDVVGFMPTGLNNFDAYVMGTSI